MIDDIQKDAKTRMSKTIESVRTEMGKLRTGRASPTLLDHVTVEYYGTQTPINQVATVSVEDARTLSVAPWEKKMIPVLEKAILESNLGLNPATSSDTIRIPLPALTEERRKEMTKLAKGEGENGKVAIRNIRRDANHHLHDLLKEKEITEDDEKKAQDKIQTLTDSFIKKIDDLVSEKEAEVMEV
ncbi:MAG: ribosome recycling factor [Gammaproteobacteria bacterium]|nr:ribosome recycling factor [Gammaproteobacteria bacterium]